MAKKTKKVTGNLSSDLRHDRRELHDLGGAPQWTGTLQTWRKRLIEILLNRPEGFTDGQRLIPGQEYKRVLPFLAQHKAAP